MNEYLNKLSRDNAVRKETELSDFLRDCKVEELEADALGTIEVLQVLIESLENRLDIVPGSEDGNTVISSVPRFTSVRKNLPRTELKCFGGDPPAWIPFWDQFRTLVHEDDTIPRVEKFSHLEGCLEGRASAIISGIPMSEQGYDDAIDLLLKNFGDSKRLIRNLNNELLRLPISRSFDEDEQLYLKCEKIFRQLLGLRRNVEDSMYFANIEGKMSAETLDKYCAIKDAEDADDWNTTKFRDAFSRALDQIRHRQELKKSVTDKQCSESVRSNDEFCSPFQ
ncbi:hypothetical protein niasHT_037887 [Heterodera trifolii]|uniref:Uncharacterized protein n=1 Tax=Heterodera trifolii TaxID=157864 RepID=A0ABD2IN77_9BILA